ncbi:MAG: hypothetical protein KDD40_04110 [Bdellovibrionales bacterium]|nr:hypothetical protein [Bdellovibrionales bacterium]
MLSNKKLFSFVFLTLSFTLVIQSHGTEGTRSNRGGKKTIAKLDCNNMLQAAIDSLQSVQGRVQLPSDVAGDMERVAVLAETHTLYELFATDDKDNLVVKRPFIIMNAAERLLAMIYAHGKKRIPLPGSTRKVDYYPFFSDGLPVVENNRVVGQYEAVADLVKGVKAQATGDRSGNSPILLKGPHGTGKSETLKIIRSAYKNMSGNLDSPFASYTFEYKDLHLIPELRRYVHIEKDSEGHEFSLNKRSETNDSPFTILPASLQDELIERGREAVADLTGGLFPKPMREADAKATFIRDHILLHYEKLKGGELTSHEALAALNNHVVVKRIIYDGKHSSTLPTIEFQGTDIDLRGLIATPDTAVQMDEGAGATPMGYHLSGKMLGANGNAILFDEILRNTPEFLNMLLAVFESRVIDIGGIPRTPLDTVIIAATNKANFDDVATDTKAHAQIDRFRSTSMNFSTRPHEVFETMLYMKSVGLVSEHLTAFNDEELEAQEDVERSVHQEISLRELFPLPQEGQPVQGPDGRYRIWFKEGRKEIEISPHALLFLSEIVSATRIVTETKGFEELLEPYGVTGDPVFKSPIIRLKYNEGNYQISGPLAQELSEVLKIIDEGATTGISSRQAGRWMSAVLYEASEPEGGNLITPDMVLQVFKRLVQEGEISGTSVAETARWMSLAERVSIELLLPRVEGDIFKALAMNNSNVDATYNQVWSELRALFSNPDAIEISGAHGRTRRIDFERLKEIKKLYLAQTGRPLDPGQIAVAVDEARGNSASTSTVKHAPLETAIVSYLAKIETQRVSIDDLVDVAYSGEANDEKKAAYSDFLKGMNRLGYNERAAIFALDTAKRLRDEATRARK